MIKHDSALINKRLKMACAAMLVFVVVLTACSLQHKNQRIPVKVLILPKFEVGEMSEDFPGEAQCFYEEYVEGGDAYIVDGCPDTDKLYYKDGVALFLAGQGKVNAALNTAAVLSDQRFDYSDAYIISVGCGGAAEGYGILGDVFVNTAAVDFDLGHQADSRDVGSNSSTTWFHDMKFDSSAVVKLDRELMDRVFGLLKNVELKTTEQAVNFLDKEYHGQSWSKREPQVLRGTSVTADNYWKGRYDHQNALLVAKTYGCEDPFSISEMEDVAVGQAVSRFGMLDRFIILKPETKYTREELQSILSDDHTPVFVFEDSEGRVLGHGFCVLQPPENTRLMTDIKTLYIDDICVDKSARGQHAGSAIYEHILAFARQCGCYNITLNVWSCNPGAKEFYEKLGLVPYKTGLEMLL